MASPLQNTAKARRGPAGHHSVWPMTSNPIHINVINQKLSKHIFNSFFKQNFWENTYSYIDEIDGCVARDSTIRWSILRPFRQNCVRPYLDGWEYPSCVLKLGEFVAGFSAKIIVKCFLCSWSFTGSIVDGNWLYRRG